MRRALIALFVLPALACGALNTPTSTPLPTAAPATQIPPTLAPTDTASAPSTATAVAEVPRSDVLAFTHDNGAVSLAIIRRDPAGKAAIVSIVSPPEWESISGVYDLVWSPDGKRLAMVGWVGPDNELAIFTTAIDAASAHASEPVNLGPGQYPAWSADGEALLAVRDDHVMRTSWDVAEWEPISNEARWYGRAIFSPDPNLLLTTSTAIGDAGASGNTTFLPEAIDVQTGDRRVLLDRPVEDQVFGQLPDDLRLAPDGTWAAFTTYGHLSACQGYSALYTMNSDGQNLQAVQIPGANDTELTADQGFVIYDYAFSPNGQGLTASWEIIDCAEMANAQSVAAQITLIDPSSARAVIDGPHASLSYSRDGSLLAATKRLSLDGSQENEIWLYDLTNGETGDVLVGTGQLARFRP